MQLNLGATIRNLRHRDEKTQEALAEALGVTSQAVSRWESGGSYPDMEIIPSIANYFGVSIDELFGYNNERSKKVDALVTKINDMNAQNNGVDINISECIALAREAMVEFPGNEKIMLSLASVLYNAGYVRYGEYHLTGEDGYDVYNTEQHRTYNEWIEAIPLYEKALKTLENGDVRNRAVCELTQLYLNIGEHDRALALAETAPDIYNSRPFLKAKATDGKQRAEAYADALVKTVRVCSELIVASVITHGNSMSTRDKIHSLRSAIELFHLICTDGNCGLNHGYIARVYTFLSLYLWLDGKKDETFEALDLSLLHFEAFHAFCAGETGCYTAPLIYLATETVPADTNDTLASISLAEDWPWWCVPEYTTVKPEIQSDPRWSNWVSKLRK